VARFYDHLRRDRGVIDPDLFGKLNGSTVIDATNLSDFLFANEAKGEWDLLRDFFNVAPPFDKFFVECSAPKQFLTKDGMVPWPKHLPTKWGVLFMATDLNRLEPKERDFVLAGYSTGDLPANLKWVLQAVLFADTPFTPNGEYNGKMRQQFSWWFPVLSDGSQPTSEERERHIKIEYVVGEDPLVPSPNFIPNSPGSNRGMMEMTEQMFNLMNVRNVDSTCQFWNPSVNSPSLYERMNEAEYAKLKNEKTTNFIKVLSLREDILSMKPAWQFHYTMVEEQYWLPLLLPCLMSVCFLHVKNVTMERVEPPAPLQKKARKRYGEPLCDYHVLQVSPFKKVLETEGRVAQTGIRQAMSICRGHFHHYGDAVGKGKLFGKYSGAYWIPAHVRGSIELGLKDKSYKVSPEKKSA
jgi:hypothetical protein